MYICHAYHAFVSAVMKLVHTCKYRCTLYVCTMVHSLLGSPVEVVNIVWCMGSVFFQLSWGEYIMTFTRLLVSECMDIVIFFIESSIVGPNF